MAVCPKEFIDTGALMVRARIEADVSAKRAEQAINTLTDVAMPKAREYGVKDAQIGRAIGLLRQAQMAPALIAEAHESLQNILAGCDVDQPSNDQIKQADAELTDIVVALGWR